MNNILKSQHKNLKGSMESVRLEDEKVVTMANVIKNVTEGKETYSYENRPINIVENKWIRLDSHQTKSDDLGTLRIF